MSLITIDCELTGIVLLIHHEKAEPSQQTDKQQQSYFIVRDNLPNAGAGRPKRLEKS